MNYKQVKQKVLQMYPELKICDSGFGIEKPYEFATINWKSDNYKGGNENDSAHYCTGTHTPTDYKFHIITIGLMKGDQRKRTLALLHEVGHHSSYQPKDDKVGREYYAWKRCKELYKVLGIPWGKYETGVASVWFGTYLDTYGWSLCELLRVEVLGFEFNVRFENESFNPNKSWAMGTKLFWSKYKLPTKKDHTIKEDNFWIKDYKENLTCC